jgi:hypothetical protein
MLQQLGRTLDSPDKLKTTLLIGYKALKDYLWGYNPIYP